MPSPVHIGIDLGGTKTEIIVLNNNGETLARMRNKTPRSPSSSVISHNAMTDTFLNYTPLINRPLANTPINSTPIAATSTSNTLMNDLSEEEQNREYNDIVQNIVSLIEQVQNQHNISDFTIGIGIPGAMDPSSLPLSSPLSATTSNTKSLTVKNANTTSLIGKPLQKDLESFLSRRVTIANDADCFALSEAMDGAGKNYSTVFGVILGTGVGGGFVVNQHLLNGPNAIAGEWGHNPLPWANKDDILSPCYCGRSGCIETFLSGPGMAQHAMREVKETEHFNLHGSHLINAKEWYLKFLDGDSHAEKIIHQYCDRLARSLAHVINIMDPYAIVLGGGLSNMDVLYEKVPDLWQQYVFSNSVNTQLLKHQHGDSSGVRGAAWLGRISNGCN